MIEIRIMQSNPSVLEGVVEGQPLTLQQLFDSVLQLVEGEVKTFSMISPLTDDDVQQVAQSAVVVGRMILEVSVPVDGISFNVRCSRKY